MSEKEMTEDKKIAVIGIIVENYEATQQINKILHEFRHFVVGRMGIPYEQRNVAVISVVVDAPQAVISAISGKLGMLSGVSSKTVTSRLPEKERT